MLSEEGSQIIKLCTNIKVLRNRFINVQLFFFCNHLPVKLITSFILKQK